MAAGNFPIHNYPDDDRDGLNEHVHEPGDPDGVVAADERKRWQESHPAPQPTPAAAYRPKKLWPKLVIVAVVLLLAALGSYWLGNRAASKHQAKKQTQTVKQAPPKQPAAATPTKHYDSATYTLGFDYPQAWTLSDTAARLAVTSPDTQLTTADGTKAAVRVVVVMQNPQTTIAGFPAGGAVAALDSAHLTYKQPSSVQRAQTYLSYLSYTAPANLDALYITGDSGYQKGQAIPLADIIKGNPLISVTFGTCTDENCNGLKPVSLQAGGWISSQAAKDVANLLESITLTD